MAGLPANCYTLLYTLLYTYVSQKDFTFDAVMQEYMKCLEKKDKYSARERTGPNVVKLENVRISDHVPFGAVKYHTIVWISSNQI